MLYDLKVTIHSETGDVTDTPEAIRQNIGDMFVAMLNTLGIPHLAIEVDVKPRRVLEVVDRFLHNGEKD